MIEVHSTKVYQRLATAHAQFFDKEPDGSPGECASVHGYDRTISLTFSGEIDENGWIVPFGELQEVKKFLEYYFDHTIVLPANDQRISGITQEMTKPGGLFSKLRILPCGVSMEMSSLFIWEFISPYITHVTNGRCYVSRVESREHECNSAYITVDRETAMKTYKQLIAGGEQFMGDPTAFLLVKQASWDYIAPKDALDWYSKLSA
jgi:6-pyruvoyl-tetrahydropterin synthase